MKRTRFLARFDDGNVYSVSTAAFIDVVDEEYLNSGEGMVRTAWSEITSALES